MPRALVLARQLDKRSGQIYGSDAAMGSQGMDAAKLAIIQAKKNRQADGQTEQAIKQTEETKPFVGISGSDSAAPPEQPPVKEEGVSDSEKKASTVATVEVPATSDGSLVIKKEEFQTFVQRAAEKSIEPALKGYKDQIRAMTESQDALNAKNNEVLKQLNDQLTTVKAESDRKSQLLQMNGSSIPLSTDIADNGAIGGSYAVNYLSFGTSKELQGAAKDFADFKSNQLYCKSANTVDDFGGLATGYDPKALNAFVKQNRDSLRKDMERYVKGNGFLLGVGRDAVQPGNTLGTAGSIPQAFLDYLSTEMRMAKHPKYIWWQFANFGLGLGTPVGSTVLVPKFENLDEPDNEANFTLDEIDNIRTIPADRQALIMNTVPVTIKGYGLGLGNTPSNRPVGIPEFIQVTSLVELMSVLNRKLTRNYNGFVDMMVRGYYRHARFNAANVFYNNSANATSTPGDITTGSDGTMTLAFLDNMFAQATDLDIPSLEDGRRVAVLSNKAASQLKSDLATQWEAPTPEALQNLTNILNASYPGGDVDNVSGYIGDYGGFHCFHNMSSSRGAVGSEGVYQGNAMQTGAAVDVALEAAVAATAVMRDSYFFGPDAVAKGTALPMQIRTDPTTNFDRMFSFIWYEICGYGPIAVSSLAADGTTATNQEDCVLIGRTSDTVL